MRYDGIYTCFGGLSSYIGMKWKCFSYTSSTIFRFPVVHIKQFDTSRGSASNMFECQSIFARAGNAATPGGGGGGRAGRGGPGRRAGRGGGRAGGAGGRAARGEGRGN